MHSSDSLLTLRARAICASLVVACSIFSAAPALTQSSGTTAVEDIAVAGPFTLTRHSTQRFSAQFTLNADDLNKQITLVLHNGIGGSPGLNWVRVFHGPDMDLRGMNRAEEPSADLVYDQNYLQRHTVSIDLSDKLVEGVNTIILEGTGPKGGMISWVIEGPPTPEFAPINPTASQAGGRLTLSGKGFSADAGENKVTVNGCVVEILSATRNSLTVKLPWHATAGQAQVVVTTNNVSSAPYTISIVDAKNEGTVW
jgi:hypothetical protein